MRRIIILAVLLLSFAYGNAQSPQKMSFQAVIRNSSNSLVSNLPIGLRVSILQGTPSGAIVYSETQTANTNVNGLVTIQIGGGNVIQGDFSTIEWANGPYFIQTETDVNGGTNYTITSITQLLSVPYALYAQTSGSSIPGPQGPAGPQGLQGVSGTNGVDGPQGIQGPQGIAGTNGTNGVDGAQGPAGQNGLSAYEIAVQNGYTGTESQWLSTAIVGPQGPAGLQGIQGEQGPIGLTGETGPQGIAGTNGSNGIDGTQGPAGLQGPQGIAGTNGINGIDGAQGPAGPQGTQGVSGANGVDGAQGPQGPAGQNGLSAYEIAVQNGYTGTESQWLSTAIVGPQGPAGPQGPQGIAGTNGLNGIDGAQGPQGIQGEKGPIGLTGPAGQQGIAGTNGVDGAQGPQGIQGEQGPAGANGINGVDGATGPQGIQGGQGPQGPQGLQGITGTNGIDGATGPQGPAGPQGAQGIQGAIGPQGPIGLTGQIGATGPQGAQGIKGDTGATGATGAQGITGTNGIDGATGPQGLQGIQGPAGFLPNGTASGNTTYWNGTDWIVNSSNLYNNGSNIGIGTTIPSEKLHVDGNVMLSGSIKAQDSAQDITLIPGTTGNVDVSSKQIKNLATPTAIKDAVTAEVVQNSTLIYGAATGAANAYEVALTPAPTAYQAGMMLTFKANVANTGAATLNINGLGAKTIKKLVTTDVAANDITLGQMVIVMYDGTNFQYFNPATGTSTLTPSDSNTLIYTTNGF